MTEDEARTWLVHALAVPRETMLHLERFATMLVAANEQQNLISWSTVSSMWARHIVDSAQLTLLSTAGKWLDLGSGAGFPGLVIAIISDAHVTLVEPRRKRVEFLEAVIAELGLERRARVVASRAETTGVAFHETITARAFAPMERIFAVGSRFACPETRWLLPKGRSAQAELVVAQRTWQGEFRLEPSVTDPGSAIVVAEQVRPRKQQ